jgi:hypothetical protein
MFETTRHHPVATAFAGVALACAGAIGLHAWQADAAPGDDDTTFVPITPCRIVDTRPAFRINTFGALSAADTITVAAHGTNGNCTLPTHAAGLSLNVTAVNPTQPTFLTVWPGGPLPNASSLNPFPGMPPTPNAVVTDLSDTGRFNVYNLAGVVEVVIDVNGLYTATSLTDLHDRLTALETENTALAARVAALETLTASMTVVTVDDQPTVRFGGVNLQIVNGTGSTREVNGRGNLIVGYNVAGDHSGSHNIAVGSSVSYTSYGGLVTGVSNAITAPWATVSGGRQNTASGESASVSGGLANDASGTFSSVSGGNFNEASTRYGTVVGGSHNETTGSYATAVGGSSNAAGQFATAVGGTSNTAGQLDVALGGDSVTCDVDDNAAVCGEGVMWSVDTP